MATLISPVPPLPDRIWRLSVDQYHSMIDAGILNSDSPVELIEGVLVEKIAINLPHAFATEEVQSRLAAIVPLGWCAKIPNPITLADSEPEPDAAVARGTRRDYISRHPKPADLALVVEVSEALSRDRGAKQRIYARAGIPVYWIVDLVNRRVEVRTDPQGESYRNLTILSPGDAIPVVIDGIEVGTMRPAAALG